MDVSFTNSRASIASARHADTDWASLSVEQRIRSIELDGYVVIPDHDPERVESLPPEVRPFFRSLNTRRIEYDLPNRPDSMARSAPGISPQRWGLVSIGSQEGMP